MKQKEFQKSGNTANDDSIITFLLWSKNSIVPQMCLRLDNNLERMTEFSPSPTLVSVQLMVLTSAYKLCQSFLTFCVFCVFFLGKMPRYSSLLTFTPSFVDFWFSTKENFSLESRAESSVISCRCNPSLRQKIRNNHS